VHKVTFVGFSVFHQPGYAQSGPTTTTYHHPLEACYDSIVDEPQVS